MLKIKSLKNEKKLVMLG